MAVFGRTPTKEINMSTRVEEQIVVAAPPAEVFAAVTDVHAWPGGAPNASRYGYCATRMAGQPARFMAQIPRSSHLTKPFVPLIVFVASTG